ncbi:MAG: hypothetical protein IPL23_28570 [Saprospiraceae bacterium]|nr:hypothetical protein [Saprospiraceae bacterium]
MSKFYVILILMVSTRVLSLGQSTEKVFLIGENQKTYDKLISSYNTHLLEVCDDSMDKAYEKWSGILYDLEKFALSEKLDIRGVKLWMNVFFDGKDKIEYIVYYPKPISKNMNYDQLSKVLDKFIKFYNPSVPSAVPFSHYGSASFPVFYSRISTNNE